MQWPGLARLSQRAKTTSNVKRRRFQWDKKANQEQEAENLYSPKQFTQQQRKGSVWTTWEGERAQFSMGRKTGRQGSVKLALGLFPFCRHLTESFFRRGTLERRQRAKRFRWGSGSFQKASAWAPSDRRSEAQLGTRLYGAWWNSGHWRARRWILATGSFGNVHGRKKEFHGMQPGPRAVRLDVLFFSNDVEQRANPNLKQQAQGSSANLWRPNEGTEIPPHHNLRKPSLSPVTYRAAIAHHCISWLRQKWAPPIPLVKTQKKSTLTPLVI